MQPASRASGDLLTRVQSTVNSELTTICGIRSFRPTARLLTLKSACEQTMVTLAVTDGLLRRIPRKGPGRRPDVVRRKGLHGAPGPGAEALNTICCPGLAPQGQNSPSTDRYRSPVS